MAGGFGLGIVLPAVVFRYVISFPVAAVIVGKAVVIINVRAELFLVYLIFLRRCFVIGINVFFIGIVFA